MKKIILLYIFIFTTLFPSDNIGGYRAFIQAKNHYLNGNFDQAKIEFENFVEVYKDSKLVNSHYPDYYIAMNYYEIGEMKNALKYLESSIYTPKYLKFLEFKKSNYFEFKRGFYLGEIYSRLGYFTNAHYQYLTLIKDYYDPDLEPLEKKALNILASKDPYYNYILEIKYKNNYKNIDKLKNDDLKMIGHYLYSKGLFLEFYKSYKNSINSSSNNKEIVVGTLNILEEANQYDLMIELIKNQFSSGNTDSDYYYFWGNALKKSNKPLEAIEKYKLVDKSPYLERSIYSIGRIYFILENYEEAILWSKKLNNDKAHELLTRSYFNSSQMDLFKESAIKYIQSYPNSNLAGYYRNMLYNESKNPNYLNWIIKHNLNSYYYQVAFNITKTTRVLEEYPLDYKKRFYTDSLSILDQLAELGDPQLLIIESDTLNFSKDKVFETFIKTSYLEKIKLYDLAMKSSLSAEEEFSKYSNLYPYLYPRYYGDLVKKYSKKYDVEESLIFSLIKEGSKFDSNLIFKSTYFGLMQLDLKTAKLYDPDITTKKLLDPEVNISIGVRHLEYLLSNSDDNISLTIAGFHDGEKLISNWKLDKNGDIDVEQIPYSDSQRFIKRVITNYYKYKSLYKD
ncbi:transglycosylase SLT domain-containing protein [Psychrilyobacter atlanticus]|uniref:transglycosylase SLT domain-containing protein n=1 Tax=Psychrilyobacter atlanticus TaxID=271091 RepID=UPI00041848D0|nr:transglycosylase SLT domain-containing protein [Psychrilyobacter atlanticus]